MHKVYISIVRNENVAFYDVSRAFLGFGSKRRRSMRPTQRHFTVLAISNFAFVELDLLETDVVCQPTTYVHEEG